MPVSMQPGGMNEGEEARQPWEQMLFGQLPDNPASGLGRDALAVGKKEEAKAVGALTGKGGGGGGFMNLLMK
jgi:hypothetical protein